MKISYQDIINNQEMKTYIKQADLSLKAMGYTEHSFAHVSKCASDLEMILSKLNFPEDDINIGKIAAYMHDIGNVINRNDHAQTGALMAFRLLDKLGMDIEDIALIITAIGNHDEITANSINNITAALILADKADVRRTRVRNLNSNNFDIHDRVNYAVEYSKLEIDEDNKYIYLILKINTSICSIMDYFEIFLNRMVLCKRAAEHLNLEFKLIINDLGII